MNYEFMQFTGNIRFDVPGLDVCAGVHELWYLHDARIPQREVWRTENQGLLVIASSTTLCVH